MSRPPIKVAVASFAHTHALSYTRALLGRGDVDVLTADPDGAEAPDLHPRGAALAAELGARFVPSYDELFAWGPDAVIVASENVRHRGLVERAAQAGAAILCEKPLATTVEDAQAMIATVSAAGVALMMAYPVRFSSSFTDLRERVRAGQLGQILSIRGTNNGRIPQGERAWFTDPELAGGGALVDHVVHCAQLIDEILGQPAESVRAVSNRIVNADGAGRVETGGLVTITYPGNLIATIDCSWSLPTSSPTWGGLTLEVVGDRGSMCIRPFAQHLAGYSDDGPIFEPVGDDLDAAMLDEFLRCVRDRCAPVADGGVGLRTLLIVDAARTSAVDGQARTIPRID